MDIFNRNMSEENWEYVCESMAYGSGTNMLILSAEFGFKKNVQKYLKRCDVDDQDRYDYTALMRACESDNDEIFDMLMEYGPNLEGQDPSPLSLAIEQEQEHMVKILIERGASIEGIDVESLPENVEIMKILFNNGLDVNENNFLITRLTGQTELLSMNYSRSILKEFILKLILNLL